MTGAARTGRLPLVDMARGAALVAMFGYHLIWDLAHFGYIDAHAPFSPGMRLASHVIACAFLFIAGASLVLAQRSPMDWRGYGKRLAMVAGAALLVSVASWFLFPEGLILFGILHCIAAASLLALPFLFLPWPAALAAALVAALLPALIASPAFNSPWALWTGLGAILPESNDFRPLLPWAAALLAGLGLTKLAAGRGAIDMIARVRGASAPSRALAFAGRHSLAIYLIHQPVFFAALTGAVWAFGPPAAVDEAPFRTSCERQCGESGAPARLCQRACGCTAREMKSLNLWAKLKDNSLDSAEKAILSRVAQQCVAHGGDL